MSREKRVFIFIFHILILFFKSGFTADGMTIDAIRKLAQFPIAG